MTEKFKTVNIKGKEYVQVNERLKYFRKHYPKHSLTSEIISLDDKKVVIKAKIAGEDGRTLAEGLAYEMAGSTFINKTSFIENCETSAWGRALANFGIGLDTSVASAEEVQNATAQHDKKEPEKKMGNYWTAKTCREVASPELVQAIRKAELSQNTVIKLFRKHNGNQAKIMEEISEVVS